MSPPQRVAVIGMLTRASERVEDAAAGTEALARALGGDDARLIGSPSPMAVQGWEDDLRESRGGLLEAGGQVEDALAAGAFPVLVAADCSVATTTLPAMLRHEPDARVAWFDAHGDFHTPETTASGYLGGMCLSAACGLWDPGLLSDDAPTLDPTRVFMHGVRDLDAPEVGLLDTRGVIRTQRRSELIADVDDRRVFVHLDLDVLDPSILPSPFPAPGGLTTKTLHDTLTDVAAACTLIGCEITGFHDPARLDAVLPAIEALLPVA
jgi:arginase